MKNLTSVKELLNITETSSSFTGLKQNLCKCGISGISALKGTAVVLCELNKRMFENPRYLLFI